MKQFSLFIHLMLSVLLFSSCGGRSKTASVIEAEKAIPLRYAENLNLSATEDYTIARLRNPWDTTRILHTYVLVDKEKPLPADLPKGTLVRTPLSKAVVYSSVHCGLLNQIGALKSIGGSDYLNNPLIVRSLAQVGTFLHKQGLPWLRRSFVSPPL